MRAVVQRATRAEVVVGGATVAAQAGPGLVVLVGVTHEDGPGDVAYIARKVADLRLLAGERSVREADGWVIVVSQFTLYADVRKGRRPTWNNAAPGAVAQPLVDQVVATLRDEYGLTVETGVFGADMAVSLTNDGPMTILLES
ncbi:D-aminoacyl-tRNA deacylase [Rarobacter incanus]|uniref:D-aminoacyl-tRNA deacylase n=1 Tax=Rarobacter incanus TaxID=153494 RepID=A0A542SPD2_9MICO|nr:D-aminoacyl-tRNA deacylase [Rarobacter incanus]TQK76425.1 D-tyrosyl-tRNA(Tyr) deacylase [Rarobacter incanus]